MSKEYTPTQTCKACKNINSCSEPDWLTGECEPGFELITTVDKNKGKSYDCTDCKQFGNCYLRRHRPNRDDVTPCKDIELDESLIQGN